MMRFRSFLNIPLNKFERTIYVKIMHKADALILDLEDSIPGSMKSEARQNLFKAMEIFQNHPNIFVRINSDDQFYNDIEVIQSLGIRNIVYPKFDMNHKLSSAQIDQLNVIPVVETPIGLFFMYQAISQIKNLSGIIFGVEDFSSELGILPTEEAMLPFAQQAILVSSILKTYCIGYASDFTDLSIEKLRENCLRSKRLGFKAAFCIHPTHLDTINEIYTVDPVFVESFDGIKSADGKMMGPPTLKRIANR